MKRQDINDDLIELPIGGETPYSPLNRLRNMNKVLFNGMPYNTRPEERRPDKHEDVEYNHFTEEAKKLSVTQKEVLNQLLDYVTNQSKFKGIDFVDNPPSADRVASDMRGEYTPNEGKLYINTSPSLGAMYSKPEIATHELVHTLGDLMGKKTFNDRVIPASHPPLAKKLKSLVHKNQLNAPNFEKLYKIYEDAQNIIDPSGHFGRGYYPKQFLTDYFPLDTNTKSGMASSLFNIDEFPAHFSTRIDRALGPSQNNDANKFVKAVIKYLRDALPPDPFSQSSVRREIQNRLNEISSSVASAADVPLIPNPRSGRRLLPQSKQSKDIYDIMNMELPFSGGSQFPPPLSSFSKDFQYPSPIVQQPVPPYLLTGEPLQQKAQYQSQPVRKQQASNSFEESKNSLQSSPSGSISELLRLRSNPTEQKLSPQQRNTDPFASLDDIFPWKNKNPREPFAGGGYVSGGNGYDPYLNTYNYAPPLRLSEYLTDQMPESGYDETGSYDDPYMSYGNGYDDDGQQYSFREGGAVDVDREELPRLADLIARYGRNGDTELAHINPIEAQILKSLGGSGTINPATGLREYSFWKKPFKAIKSVLGGGAGAIIGNMIAPGIGGIIGGALGQGVQHAARGKSALGGALKGAGMGAALPSMASGLGWGASRLGATALGSSLSNYGTTNAILPALGLGGSGSSSGLFGLGGSNPYVNGGLSAATALSSGMGTGRGQGLGVSSGDYAENYYNYMLDRQKKQDNMGFTDKLQDYLTQPGNLLTLGTTAAQYLGREKPKSPEKIAAEERRYRNASRKTIAEVEADEALEIARKDLKKKHKNKQLEEDIKNMGSARRHVVSPEEFARTGRWLEYEDDEGRPIRMKGGGLMRSPYDYLVEEVSYPTASPLHYLNGDSGGQDDLIDAKLSDGEYVIDAATVADLGDGNNAAGARKLDNFRRNIREHKRGGKITLPPRAKSLQSYLMG